MPRCAAVNGPLETFIPFTATAVRLHQTGHSLRVQNRAGGELVVCGQSVLSLHLLG